MSYFSQLLTGGSYSSQRLGRAWVRVVDIAHPVLLDFLIN